MTRALALAILLAGCSDDTVDLTGIYRVDGDVESEPCGVDQPIAMPPAYLKLARDELFGAQYYYYEECPDETGTNCTGLGLFGNAFSEPVDGGWLGIITTTSGTAPTCALSYTEQTATVSGQALVIEIERHGDTVDTEALCTTDEAKLRNTSMPCERHERIDATKL